jgi:hypothetical protein
MLSARIVNGDRRILEVADTQTLPLESASVEDDHAWIPVAERELAVEFDLERPPLGRCTLLRNAAHSSFDLIFTFPHALVDGTAVTQLIRELIGHLSGQGIVEIPADQDLPKSCDQLFPQQWKRPRRLLRSAGFLCRQLSDEVSYRLRTHGRHSKPPAGPFQNRILPIALPEDETMALVRASRMHRVSLVALLEAAMLIAVARHCYPGLRMPHRYCAFPLLRRYLEPAVADDVVGCYITVLRLTAEVSGKDDLWKLAATINRDLDQSMRRGERFLASVWSHFSMRTIFSQHSHRMSTTALSYTGATAVPDAGVHLGVREIHAFVSNFPLGPQYTAQARLFQGRLWLDILYLDSDMDAEQAGAIADTMRELLLEGGDDKNGPENEE